MINLALADLLMAVFDILHNLIYYLHLPFPNNVVLCKFYCFARWISIILSLLIATAISIERFVIVFFPFKASQNRSAHKCITMAVAWLCAALLSIVVPLGAELRHVGNLSQCIVVHSIISTKCSILA